MVKRVYLQQGNARVLPHIFFVKEDNKNIRVFEITSLCASLGDGEACFLRQGAAHIRPHIFYC